MGFNTRRTTPIIDFDKQSSVVIAVVIAVTVSLLATGISRGDSRESLLEKGFDQAWIDNLTQ